MKPTTIAALLALTLVLASCGWGATPSVPIVDGVAIPTEIDSSGSIANSRRSTLIRVPRCLSSLSSSAIPDKIHVAVTNIDGNLIFQAFAEIDPTTCPNPHEPGDLKLLVVKVPATFDLLFDGYCLTINTPCETEFGKPIPGA